MLVFESFSAEDTYQFGKKLGEQAKPGEIYCLNGDLGTGKTVFTKGFAAGLSITEAVNSPTFTILQIYEEGRLPLYHFDVYRIDQPEELYEVGCEDYFFGQGVCLVEWAELIEDLLPDHCIRITIKKELSKGFSYRTLSVDGMEIL